MARKHRSPPPRGEAGSGVHIEAAKLDAPENTPTPIDLPSIAAEVRALHAAAQNHFGTTLSYAAKAGALLLAAKKVVGHGRWLKFLEEQCGLNERTAQTYAQVHRHWPQIEAQIRSGAAVSSIRGALALIEKPREQKPEPEPQPGSTRQLPAKPPLLKAFDEASVEERRELLRRPAAQETARELGYLQPVHQPDVDEDADGAVDIGGEGQAEQRVAAGAAIAAPQEPPAAAQSKPSTIAAVGRAAEAHAVIRSLAAERRHKIIVAAGDPAAWAQLARLLGCRS